MQIEYQHLHAVAPTTARETLMSYLDPINLTLTRYRINNRARVSIFLAQLAHESQSFTRGRENMNYSAQRLLEIFGRYFTVAEAHAYAHQPERIANRVYANRYGNRGEFSGDGWRYRGGGPLGLTFRANYMLIGQRIGHDLTEEPESISRPDIGTLSAGAFWDRWDLNGLADRNMFDEITRYINGGCTGINDRKTRWKGILEVLQ